MTYQRKIMDRSNVIIYPSQIDFKPVNGTIYFQDMELKDKDDIVIRHNRFMMKIEDVYYLFQHNKKYWTRMELVEAIYDKIIEYEIYPLYDGQNLELRDLVPIKKCEKPITCIRWFATMYHLY